jgi:hypothetical protein
MKGSIALSPKHGLNPTIPKCFICGQNKNEILLLGRLKKDEEAPHNVCFDYSPCDSCRDWMKQGIILISVDEKKSSDKHNPYRTGGWTVIKAKAARRIFGKNSEVLKKRVAFLCDRAWDKLRLPRTIKDSIG